MSEEEALVVGIGSDTQRWGHTWGTRGRPSLNPVQCSQAEGGVESDIHV